MPQTITIDPVTRVEGHGKITLQLDDDGQVRDAMFHVTQFRAFEKFVEGRPLTEMPSITARICGICPVSHLLASSKACDDLLAVEIPPTASKLRRMLNLAQMVQSHALSFFHLSSPDFVMGWDAPVAKRNILGVIAEHPDLARDGVRLRQIGQSIIALLAGKRIHAPWTVPGGVNEPLSAEKREQILAMMPESLAIAQRTLAWFKRIMGSFVEEARSFANFPSMFLSLLDRDGTENLYDGALRVVDSHGKVMQDKVECRNYQDIIGEAVEPYSYMKFPYYKPLGYPDGMYRVGPLARLNVVDQMGTELADQELAEFRELSRGAVLSSLHYHYARLVEILFGVEKIQQLLDDPEILSKHVRSRARPNRHEGVGIIEAPRGTLIHHYKIDDNGQMTWASLIVATGHNNLAINRGVLQVAQRFVDGKKLQEGMLNRCEAVIRCYDPCLSCATHAVGKMPLKIELVNFDGKVLDEVSR